MKNSSVETLLEWLRKKPQTLGWDAIVAYDRNKTNTVLLQEYIGRFGTDDELPGITEEITDQATPTQKEYIADYRMDTPLLSFINSNLLNSKAQLSMTVIGGSHLTLEKPMGAQHWSVTKIAQEDVLSGPKLLVDIQLEVAEGTANSAGSVQLDLAAGSNYRLTYAETERQRKLAGERFQQRFAGLSDPQRIWVLNEMEKKPDQWLKPWKFYIRTHAKPGGIPGDDKGEGAVLLFITMEGRENGSYPADSTDLEYLLPDGHSATVLLGHEMMISKICAEGARRASTFEDQFSIKLHNVGEFKGMEVYGGRGSYGHKLRPDNSFTFEVISLITNYHDRSDDNGGDPTPGYASFGVGFNAEGEGTIGVVWVGYKYQPCFYYFTDIRQLTELTPGVTPPRPGLCCLTLRT